jgi:hypothetical protein
VGRILDALAEEGLDEATLVVFTSDNGPWDLAETLFGEPTGSAFPLRGWKSQTWEAVSDAEGWKLHLRKDLRPVRELYFLPEDISESRDLFADRPDVVARLAAAAEAFDAEITANARPVGDAAGPE